MKKKDYCDVCGKEFVWFENDQPYFLKIMNFYEMYSEYSLCRECAYRLDEGLVEGDLFDCLKNYKKGKNDV